MAEDSDLERTEPASPKRLEQAREEGDVPRSRELSTCTILLAAGAGLWMSGGSLIRQLNHMLIDGLSMERTLAFDHDMLFSHIGMILMDVLLAFAPLGGLLMLVAIGSPLLIGGWLFSAKALQPNFSRMNPLSGLTNMISSKAGVELVKAILKALIVGTVAWIVVMNQKDAIFGLASEPLAAGSAHMATMLAICFLSIVGALVLIAGIDVPYQMWSYAKKLKMTHQEVIQESKEANGNPQIKAKIRAQQREMARRRMMSEVPTADVVVTNPTHYAVALKYKDGSNGAPRVVAKGADAVAAKIRELAAENNIPLLEAPPLARALFKHTELGDEIPETLYAAVAEVLAYVFQLKTFRQHGGLRPSAPFDLAVPAELDPNNAPQPANTVGANP
ncbi:flagellar biosynthesis protein FlhB [Undibacterium sp. RTI2.1]|uniref:flagellar biosynthesis protein FlhB n=1 Tax=unclassified Undibacterium TaxID=2630295 RepID=UPI002AB37A47|nr:MULTISPECIES: flagellar biosynthesis protein FlhB [unclassified Undibacterium]MDY7538000.1 flagellar biosynthesis protein FlhB [Undibacterium sp. 5I1]MEB0032021.1 flagellar biosynthesis protein FlhB [Undibacterium sp. RTI2.1]MEB0117217.1 flagellar biosynthesis protein FlhB [Undibacterium sp. RTI2.2]MEB0231090.1 flagellar biosynthesis protein FlhB [Undibacterium sp. 10I3]MEB0257511.1 flagellar biosynthesis protein FlhB [Undibacterium sp. 5I1]